MERPFRRRHVHWLEEWRGSTVFTKAAADPESVDDLHREAAVLRLLDRRLPGCSPPRLIEWSEADRTLRVEAFSGRDLATRTRSSGLLDMSAARALGETLAALHRDGAAAAEALGTARSGPVGIHRPTVADMRGLSAGAIDVVALIQRAPALFAHLDRLCVPPATETLIHGDVRFENVMIDAASRARLVDWESAGAGEGLWDVASAIAWGVAISLASIPQIPGVAPNRLLHAAEIPLAAIQPGLGALWEAYRDAMSDDGLASLRRCLELVAVRLVHLAMDTADDLDELRAVPVLHLQLAANLLDEPAPGCRAILGLPYDDRPAEG